MLNLKKLLTKILNSLTVTTTTNAIQLRDGSATATVKATGTQTTRVAGRVHYTFIDIPLANVTISTVGFITGLTGLPASAKFPASLNITGSKYAIICLQYASTGTVLRGDINGTMANPTFTTDTAGDLRASFAWAE